LEIQNIFLLSKWIFKLLNEEGAWQDMLRNKYLKTKSLAQVTRKPGDSHFWAGLMDIKDKVLSLGRFAVHDGEQARFWEDIWIGNEALMVKYPSLYQIVRKKQVSVASVLHSIPLNISFRRALTGERLELWKELVRQVCDVSLNGQRDAFLWNLTKDKNFTVASMYTVIMEQGESRRN
jgi:hypothetical protein